MNQLVAPKIVSDNFESFPIIIGCKRDGIDEGCKYCIAVPSAQKLGGLEGLIYALYKEAVTKGHWNNKIIENLHCLKKVRKAGKAKTRKNYLASYSGEIARAKVSIIAEVLKCAYKYPMHNFLFPTRLPELLLKKVLIAIERLKKDGIDLTYSKNLHVITSISLDKYKFRIDVLRKFPKFFKKHIWYKPLLGNICDPDYSEIISVRIAAEKGRHKRECKQEWINNIISEAKIQGVKAYHDKPKRRKP